MGKSTHFIEQQ